MIVNELDVEGIALVPPETDTPLIVDDEAGIRGFLRATLEAHGYTVREASTGEAALQVVPAFRPDLILLDIVLPVNGEKQFTS